MIFSFLSHGTAALPATTRILTPGGQRPIASLLRGQPVLSWDPAQSRMVLAQVLKVRVATEAVGIRTLSLNDGPPVLEASDGQRFLTRRGWTALADLAPGDQLRRLDDAGQSQFASISAIHRANRFPPTYRLITSGPGTVVADGVVTHNFPGFGGVQRALAILSNHLRPAPRWRRAPRHGLRRSL